MEIGTIVKSMSGHDKESFYAVVKVKDQRVFIADGRRRKVQNPKAKNPSHLQKTQKVMDLTDIKTNKNLRRVLWEYNFTSHNPVAK